MRSALALIPTPTAAATRQRIAEGFLFITLSNDFRFLDATAKPFLEEIGV